MRPDAYDMMLMGALGGAILVAVPAFAIGYWLRGLRERKQGRAMLRLVRNMTDENQEDTRNADVVSL